jgi:hypothetical protein
MGHFLAGGRCSNLLRSSSPSGAAQLGTRSALGPRADPRRTAFPQRPVPVCPALQRALSQQRWQQEPPLREPGHAVDRRCALRGSRSRASRLPVERVTGVRNRRQARPRCCTPRLRRCLPGCLLDWPVHDHRRWPNTPSMTDPARSAEVQGAYALRFSLGPARVRC